MRRILLLLLLSLSLSLALPACRTVPRGYQSTMSSVSVNLPTDLEGMTATAAFTKQGSNGNETIVKGKDLNVRLAHGDYKVALSIFDKDNVKQLEACDKDKIYSLARPKETLVISVCKLGSGEEITRTVPKEDKESNVDVEVKEDAFRSGKAIVNGVYFAPGASCFGQEPLPKIENEQIIVRLKNPVQLPDLQDAKSACDFGVAFKKPSGQIYLPLKARWTFDVDDETSSSEIYVIEQLHFPNNSSIPCPGIPLEKKADPIRVSTCSLWKDPVARGKPIRQRTFSNICGLDANYLDLRVSLRPLGEKEEVTKLDLKEIRIDLPKLEPCTPTGERPEVDPKELLLACTREGLSDGTKCRACEDKFDMASNEFKACLKN